MKATPLIKWVAILLMIWWVSYGAYVLLSPIISHVPMSSGSALKSTGSTTSANRMVMYVYPKTYVNTKSAITSYLGEIQVEKNGQIFAYRSGIVESYLANVGDTVKKWQTVARMIPAEFSPEIANMIAERKSERTRSEGMLKSAELTLKDAKSRKEAILKASNLKLDNAHLTQVRVGESTTNQVQKTIVEQDSKVEKIKSNLDAMTVQITAQEKTIENVKNSTNASVTLESDKLWLKGSTVKTAIKNAHATLFRIFYGSSAISATYLPSQLKSPFSGNANSSATNDFVFEMISLHTKYQKIDSLSQDEIFSLARDTVKAVDSGTRVLDSVSISTEYSESMLNADKSDLIAVKTDSMNGILTLLNMYEEQKSMLAKETAVSSKDYSTEVLLLQKLKAEQNVLQKEYELAKAEKERMLADVRNMKNSSENEASKMVAIESADQIMSLTEADRMITEWEKMLIDAKSAYQASVEALWVLESAGFSNEIRAPFDGKITRRYVNAGASIAMSTPLFDIVGTDTKKTPSRPFVRFEIPESDIRDVRMGQEVRLYRTVEPLRKFSAKLVRISPAVDLISKGVVVEAEVSESAREIGIGSSVRVELEKAGNMLLIPTASVLQSDDTKPMVFVIDQNSVIRLKSIVTERTIGLNVYVASGIDKEDRIVDLPKNYPFLEEGITVNPMEKEILVTPANGTITMPEWHKH